ncbi:MAG: FHA domain-containing protein [Lachnospiraceae bacterium]|nr:FHA domain-containing protein [Lachnospiraceae bacterium]
MLESEYVRNCNCNYQRILLEEKPEDKRYQYCILSRGGIRYLLPCSLRYMDNKAYLYYDISSTQNLIKVFGERKIDRSWMKDFLWGMKQLRYELDRFLLEEEHIIWSPEHIYQDLEKNDFSFLYIPYFQGETGLSELLDFMVERVTYEDERLVEFVYGMHEKINQIGIEYLHHQIHEDFEKLESEENRKDIKNEENRVSVIQKAEAETPVLQDRMPVAGREGGKKGLRFFLDGKRNKQAKKEEYRELLRRSMNEMSGYAVCEAVKYNKSEEVSFEEEFGKTIYIEETAKIRTAGLYKLDGELVTLLEKFPFVIGKKKEAVDLVLNDYSASRVHARIIREEGGTYIEDVNSTNGTFKNGLRLQPYEKRKLEVGDELRFGKTEYVYR